MPGTTHIIDAPLAPGRVPILGHLPKLAAHRLEFLQELRSGGDIVRIQLGRRSMYVLNSPEAIYQVLVAQSRHFGKGLLFDRARPFVGNGIITSDGEFHRRQRRALQPAFHPDRIAEYTGALADAARRQIDSWCTGRIMAMDREMRRLASAMLLAALFPSGTGAAANQTVEDIGERSSPYPRTTAFPDGGGWATPTRRLCRPAGPAQPGVAERHARAHAHGSWGYV